MKTPAESIAVLKHFGYSEREAKFLYLGATHSGVLVQRQYRSPWTQQRSVQKACPEGAPEPGQLYP